MLELPNELLIMIYDILGPINTDKVRITCTQLWSLHYGVNYVWLNDNILSDLRKIGKVNITRDAYLDNRCNKKSNLLASICKCGSFDQLMKTFNARVIECIKCYSEKKLKIKGEFIINLRDRYKCDVCNIYSRDCESLYDISNILDVLHNDLYICIGCYSCKCEECADTNCIYGDSDNYIGNTICGNCNGKFAFTCNVCDELYRIDSDTRECIKCNKQFCHRHRDQCKCWNNRNLNSLCNKCDLGTIQCKNCDITLCPGTALEIEENVFVCRDGCLNISKITN